MTPSRNAGDAEAPETGAMTMAYCVQCGQRIAADAPTCPRCGVVRIRQTSWFIRVARALAVALPVVIGLVSAVVATIEYRDAQRWKRQEFLATEIKDMRSDYSSHVAMQMLDWNERHYELTAGVHDSVMVTDSTLLAALTPHPAKTGGFNDNEALIRDHFDDFFDRLGVLERHIKADLIEAEDLIPHIGYYLQILGDTTAGRKPAEVIRGMWRYLSCYEFGDTQDLLLRYGYHIDSTPVPGCPTRRF